MSDKDEAPDEQARAAFVKLVKEENFYSDHSKQSLKAHWSGASSGFANHMVQARWHDFRNGWRAAEAYQQGVKEKG